MNRSGFAGIVRAQRYGINNDTDVHPWESTIESSFIRTTTTYNWIILRNNIQIPGVGDTEYRNHRSGDYRSDMSAGITGVELQE